MLGKSGNLENQATASADAAPPTQGGMVPPLLVPKKTHEDWICVAMLFRAVFGSSETTGGFFEGQKTPRIL